MATTSAFPYSGYASFPQTLPAPQQGYASKLYLYLAVVTYAAQAAADIIKLFRLPKGTLPLLGFHTTSVTTGSATLAYGITGTTGKYRAAAAYTTADTPTLFGPAAANITNGQPVPLALDEEVIATVGTAALPASGTLLVGMLVAGV